jgi:hypothetical protein
MLSQSPMDANLLDPELELELELPEPDEDDAEAVAALPVGAAVVVA